MKVSELKFYIYKLSNIPNIIDSGPGEDRCREIGKKIYSRWGEQKLLYVHDYYRDKIDRTKALYIEKVWWDYSGRITN